MRAGLRVDRRAGFAAAVERLATGVRAVDDRLLPPVDVLARVPVDFFAVLRFAVERFAAERLAAGLRAPPLARADPVEEPLLVLALVSIDHLPVMTR